MNILRSKTATIREKRTQAIAAYSGSPDTLLQEAQSEGQLNQRVRTFSQDVPSDILYALQVIASIKDAAVIVHGALGCGVYLPFLEEQLHGRWAVTNLNERDSIMGSDSILRNAIRQLRQLYRPSIIFIVSTPLVAINNDDIESVVEELKEELGVAIVPVYSDGFRSKTGVTGYDVLAHAILKHIPPAEKEEKAPFLNLLSVSEGTDDLKEVHRLLQALGFSVNLFPQYTSLDNIKQLAHAAFSLAVNPDDGDYPGTVLKERFEVPFLKPIIPVGIANTEAWLSEVGRFAGIEEQVSKLIETEKETLNKYLENNPSGEQQVFLSLPPALAFGVFDLLKELGYKVVGLKTSCLDASHLPQLEKIKAEIPDFNLLVGEGQLFEEENVVQKLRPEIYIGKAGDYSVAIRNGIPVVDLVHVPVLGFSGAVHLADKIKKALSNTSFVQRLAQIETKTHTDSWLKRNPNWYIKQEVK